MTTHINSWLRILLLCSLCSFLLAVAPAPASSNPDCPYESLPDSLDTLSGVGFNGELHLHNEYYTPFTRGQNQAITFTLTQTSVFRMYIEPHSVDIDIWLYNNSSSITHTSDYSLADEVITATLQPGFYRIRIYFFGTFPGTCPTMTTEISIVPQAVINQRVASFQCPPAQVFPNIDFGSITQTGFTYDSALSPSIVLNVQNVPTSAPFAFLKSYQFTVPQLLKSGDNWEVEAVLGSHFPTSALGLLIQDINGRNPPVDLSCFDAGNCSIASHNVRGQSTLKVLLLPGTYVLWIYDVPRDRDTSLTTCNPFTMWLKISHAEQIEDFLNCDGEPFPVAFSEPGLLDENGYMYYREDVLIDLATTTNTVQFTVEEDSYFRAFTVAHRIDIDLKLLNASKTLAYGYQYGSTEEGIQSVISAGNYTFQMILFGKYSSVFCETALLEIAIAPISLYSNTPNQCAGQTTSTSPNITGLATLNQNSTFILPYATYRYVYSSRSQTTILSQTFNVSTDSYIQAQLGSNFLLGDIRLLLTTTFNNGSTSPPQLGYHRRNMHFLDVLLPATKNVTYTLSIVTSDTQSTSVTGFPTCAVYSLSLSVIPAASTGPQACLSNRPFPSTLNTPQNLDSSPKIHLQEEFLVPKIDNLYARETVVFYVNTTSFFRFYTEPHHIDIDLKLEENTTTVAQAISFNLEEALSWVLKPSTKYTLTITYYKWFFVDHGNDPCYTYDAELAISPLTDNSASTNCAANNLPANINLVTKDAPVYIEDDFYFVQGSNQSDYRIKFQITAPSLFRALVGYDFVWNDLAIKLDLPGSSDPVQGELGYNKNEISLLTLSPGNYTLHIYEPFATTTKALALRNCVNFHLIVGIEVVSNDVVDPLLLSCPDQYLPDTLNAPAFLSSLSGNNVDFNRYVLADVTARTDSVSFAVVANSAFRVYIPVDPLLDIDVTLYRGTTQIASQVSYGKEEIIQMQLTPANYTLKFNFYGLVATSILPPASACAAFRLELSIFTMAYLQSVPSLNSACDTNFLTSSQIIDPNVGANKFSFTRSLDTQITFYRSTSFTIRTTYLFTAKFDQNAVSSGLAMLLQSANVSKTYNPLYFLNHIYLNEYLPAGTYNLSFHDPSNGKSNLFKCAPYQLTYALAPSTDVPGDTCNADTFPTDLISTVGGSTPFGGPQDGTGFIHFYGENFVMPKAAKNKNNYVLFKVPQKSYMRIFLAVEPGNTITVNLFQNANLTSSAPIASTIANGGTDRSNVWVLQPQADSYVLDLYFTTISSSKLCNFFTFELVVEPETAVLGGLACPVPLPSEQDQLPPETINVFAKQDFKVSSDDFLITSQKYVGNSRNGAYTYTMTINVASNASLSAMVGYDFVVNEFALVLQTSTGSNLTTGIHQESASTDSGINFMNYLEWRLAPGTYRLLLVDIGAKTYNLTNFCHSFSFSISISSVDPTVAPRILQLQPSSGSNLNSLEPLLISVTFSEAATIAVPSNTSLFVYLGESNIAYLRTGTTKVLPTDALFDSSNSVLRLRFEGFAEGKAYSLVFDTTKFYTRRNATLGFDAGVMSVGHNYVMHTCSCNGRGTCRLAGNVYVCDCQGNWTGSSCEKCATGFHAAGTVCVPNVPCTNTTCSGHGNCIDAAGYPTCSCRYGFTGLACEFCAPGFVGYPNCTANATDTDEDESCFAPLLPTDLNTPAYLGYAGHMHMQGWYYINQVVKLHETYFNLTERSLLRIYSEPHEIDVDVWLYRINDGKAPTAIAYEIAFGLEESFYLTLDPASYFVRFRYYFWVKPSTTCATFNLEWAISPVAAVQTEVTAMNAYCGGGLPALSNLNINTPYSFSKQGFAVSAPTKPGTEANYFYSVNITISPPAGQVASLHATLGYRFLPGDVSLLLEAGKAGTHCSNTGSSFSLTPPPGCTYGDNLQNVNTLHTFVEAGDYILWIYEPVKQNANITTCAPFDFSLTVDFVDDEQDVFSCNLAVIPLSLDTTQYTENPGYIHFKDSFVLDDRTMSFTATQQSNLRVSIGGADTTVVLYSAASSTLVSTSGDAHNIVATLAAGKYYLKFTGDFFSFCPVLHIEFALAPASVVASAVTCPSNGQSTSPSLTIASYPFEFGSNRTNPVEVDYYTFNTPNTPTVASYTFRLNANGFIDASVESDFLRGNLRLALYDGASLVASGLNNYNQQLLQKVLEPARNYELRIVLPPGQRPSGYPSCIKYNFFLHIHLTSSASPACTTNRLPYTLNSLHFLGYEGTMNYQSDNWRIPSLLFATFHNINFTVPNQSLIRVYTEPHDIDIDIKILSGSGTILVSGSNAIGTEESLTYMLSANTPYILQLQFYNFFGSGYVIPPCESFNMEIEIGPLPTRPTTCQNGGNSWPADFPSTLTLPFIYNSVDSNQHLYIQQQAKSPVSHNMTLNLPTTANVHFEVGYDFLVGDLVIKLYSYATKEFYYGYNKVDRNVLNLINLPKGQYSLTIYEPTANLDAVLGCSDFTFEASIEAYSALIDEERYLVEYYLPESLDSLAYLKVSNKVHLSNNLFMFDGTALHENTTFTILQTSLLRVDSMLFESEVAAGRLEAPTVTLYNSGGAPLSSSNSTLLTTIQPGKYMLKFSPPASLIEQDDLGVIVSVQIAINTIANLQLEINNSPAQQTCAATQFSNIMVSPTGYYQDGASYATVPYSQLSTTHDIIRLPFTLNRFSIVYLQVGSQFLISELQTRIVDASNSTAWHGRLRKNINEVHQALPAGSYYVHIRQPVIQSASTGSIAHCGLYSYSLIIKDSTDPNAVVDCALLRQVPWQLDSNSGGSSPYGGPIVAGNLHYYADNMHVPTQATSYINFTIATPSLVSVLVTNYPTAFSSIDIAVQKTGVNQNTVMTPTSTADLSRLSLYSLPTSSPYALALNYRRGSATNGLCYSYTLQVDIQPVTSVQSVVSCPASVYATPLPTSIPLNELNYAIGTVNSFFQGWAAVNGLQKSISFTVQNTTAKTPMVVTLAYNSLVSTFTMKLLGDRNNVIATAQTRGQAARTGKTNVYLYLGVANLSPGKYSINISHPSASVPFGSPAALCAPFVFTYQYGVFSPSQVEISNVSPTSQNDVAPTDKLVLTITFSGNPYSNGSAILSANSAVITAAFYLDGSDGTDIYPESAVGSADSRTWVITFPYLTRTATFYTLALKDNLISDNAGGIVTLPATHTYKTIGCATNGHGLYNNTLHACVCEAGYIGTNCDSCDTNNGYVYASGVCVIDQCKSPAVCGCFDASTCTSTLGSCATNSSGMAQCTCNQKYTGDHCELCAPGYQGSAHPSCASQCNTCVHGTCVAPNTCKCSGNWGGKACDTCPSNFAGSNCDQCADGFSGTNCDEYVDKGGKSDWGATKTFLEVTGILIIIALAGAGAFWYWRYRRASSRYQLVTRFNMDEDDDEGGHRFPDSDNRLVDDDDHNPHNQFSEHSIDDEEEPTVSLPDSAGAINSAPEPPKSNNTARLIDM